MSKFLSNYHSNEPFKISFVTTCKDRLEFLQETLPKNLEDNSYAHVEFLILDYDCPQNTMQWVKDNFQKEIAAGKVNCFKLDGTSEGFNFPHAKNLAHRAAAELGNFSKSKNHILCSLDADNFTGKNFADFIAESFEKKPNKVLMYDTVATLLHFKKAVDVKKYDGIGGRIAYQAQDFYRAGGFNEHKQKSWGPDDTELKNRMVKMLNYNFSLIPAEFLTCVNHENQMRYKHSPDSESTEIAKNLLGTRPNERSILQRLTTRVAKEVDMLLNGVSLEGKCFGRGSVLDLNGNITSLNELPTHYNKFAEPTRTR